MIAAAPQGAKSTTIVTVTYNSSNVLPDMLESVPDDIPVIIVDNNSVDASRIAEISEAHATQLVRNEANVGFGQACNQGARLASSELVMFLNPDARLTEGSLECLEFAALKYPNASAFSPSLESPGGRFVLNPATSIEYRGWRLPKGRPWMDREIPFISGAAALVRKSAFDTIGGFDPNIFLFYEDDDLSLRLRRECGPLMFIRNATVIHIGGRSSGLDSTTSRLKAWHFGYSRVYTQLKHDQPLAFERALLWAIRKLLNLPRMVSRATRAERFGLLSGVLAARRWKRRFRRN